MARQKQEKTYPSRWRYYGLIFIAWAVYIILTLMAPDSQSSQEVKLSTTAIVILQLTLLVPYMLTWLIATIGWYNFSRFASDTERKKIPSSTGFRYISRGLGLLIFDLIFIPMFSLVRRVWGESDNIAVILTVTSNYFHIIIPLIAFGFLYAGSRKLALSGHYATGIRSRPLPALVASTLFIVLYSIAVIGNTSRQVASGAGQFASFYISDPLIVLTIIIPLFITWLLGLQTALNTERYMHSLLQPQWRTAIIHFFHGILAILSSSIIFQGITAFGNQQLQQISLALLLLIIYLFILIQAAGYLYIRTSARQLRRLIQAGTPHEID